MNDRIHELLHCNLQQVFGEGEAVWQRCRIFWSLYRANSMPASRFFFFNVTGSAPEPAAASAFDPKATTTVVVVNLRLGEASLLALKRPGISAGPFLLVLNDWN